MTLPSVPRFDLPAGTEMTLGGARVVINGTDELAYRSTDLTTGESRSIPFQSFVDYLNLPGAKLDTALPLTGNRLKQRLGGYATSRGLSAAEQADACFHVAICKAMIIVRDQMREEANDKTLELSGRKAEEKREAIRQTVQALIGEKVYLTQPRGGKPQKARRYLYKGRTLRDMLVEYEILSHDESAFDALVPFDHLKGNRTPRIVLRTRALMLQAWEEVGLDTKRPGVADVMRHLEILIHEENRLRCRNDLQPLQVPSASTLGAFRKEVIGEAAYLVGTTGERNARNRRGRGSTDIRALLIGEYVEIDECKVSLVVSARPVAGGNP